MNSNLVIGITIGGALASSFFRTIETAEEKSTRLGKQWQQTNKKLAATGAVVKYRNVLDELRKKQSTLGHSSQRLENGIKEVEHRYKQAKRQARAYGINIGQVAREHKLLNRELANTHRQQTRLQRKQALGSHLGSMRGKMLGLAGAGYGLSRVVGSAMQREEQGLYLRTVINTKDGDKETAVARARQSARAFARNSLASEQEVLEIEYALNSAGMQEDIAREGTQLVHKLAKVTRGTPELVGEIFGVTFNNLGASIEGTTDEKMKVIGNVLAKTQIKFQIRDFGQLGESLKYAAASAKGANIPLDQTAVILGQLNSAGLQGSMAGTAFSAMERNLTKASEALDFSIIRNKNGEMDLIGTLGVLERKLSGMDIDERGDLIQKLFNDEGKRGLIQLLSKLDEMKAAYVEMREVAQSDLVNKEYQHFVKSTLGQWLMFKQNIGQVGDVFASTLLPTLNKALVVGSKIATWTASMIERYPVIGKTVGYVGVGFLMVGSAIMSTTASMWVFNAFMTSKLVAGVKWLGAGLLSLAKGTIPILIKGVAFLGRALLMNPIGLIITGIAMSGYMIYKHWGPIKQFMSNLWGGIKTLVGASWEAIKTWFSWTPLGMVINNWQPIVDWLTTLPNKFGDIGQMMIDGLIGGIVGMKDSAITAIGSVADSVLGTFTGLLGINSPSRVFMGYGTNIGQGLTLGMQNQIGDVVNANQRLGLAAANDETYQNTIVSLASRRHAIPARQLPDLPSDQQINQALNSQNASMTIHFSPTIQVNGNAQVQEQVQQGLDVAYREFERNMRRFNADTHRRKLA